MSTHPNVLLILTLTPDGLARKTYRDILGECGAESTDDEIKINGEGFSHFVAESDYEDNWQVSAPEGSIVLLDLVTYGYGEQILWDELSRRKAALEEWSSGICERHHCSAKISVGANYW